jgi:hypothetical protein
MALQKTLIHPKSGVSGNYIRLVDVKWNRSGDRYASAHFELFLNKEIANTPGALPVHGCAGKLELTGALFDKYLGKSVLATKLVLDQCYVAAQAEPAAMSSDFHTYDTTKTPPVLVGAFSGATRID